MNFGQLAEILGLEEDEFFDLVDLFVGTTASDLARLEIAISDGSADQAADAAHSIKGAALNLGFEEIHLLAKDVELNARQSILDGSLEAAQSMRQELTSITKVAQEKQKEFLFGQ
jgi:HPt (histidine-containing phosphotransfer) domain-containing protein